MLHSEAVKDQLVQFKPLNKEKKPPSCFLTLHDLFFTQELTTYHYHSNCMLQTLCCNFTDIHPKFPHVFTKLPSPDNIVRHAVCNTSDCFKIKLPRCFAGVFFLTWVSRDSAQILQGAGCKCSCWEMSYPSSCCKPECQQSCYTSRVGIKCLHLPVHPCMSLFCDESSKDPHKSHFSPYKNPTCHTGSTQDIYLCCFLCADA